MHLLRSIGAILAGYSICAAILTEITISVLGMLFQAS